jgi:hypothetical protein
VTDAQLAAMNQDAVYSTVSSETLAPLGGPTYCYFALRADLGPLTTFMLDGNPADFTLLTRDVTDSLGYTASYNIYRNNTPDTTLHVLTTT